MVCLLLLSVVYAKKDLRVQDGLCVQNDLRVTLVHVLNGLVVLDGLLGAFRDAPHASHGLAVLDAFRAAHHDASHVAPVPDGQLVVDHDVPALRVLLVPVLSDRRRLPLYAYTVHSVALPLSLSRNEPESDGGLVGVRATRRRRLHHLVQVADWSSMGGMVLGIQRQSGPIENIAVAKGLCIGVRGPSSKSVGI